MTQLRCIDCHRWIRRRIVKLTSKSGIELGTFGYKCARKAKATFERVGLEVVEVVEVVTHR